ncbi:hypothetical protein CGRA01v4_11434 [Colletotrichum graminicola]|nr:hypothetical protein CGRA01v4_11434 [Colletotrichum graminicola]
MMTLSIGYSSVDTVPIQPNSLSLSLARSLSPPSGPVVIGPGVLELGPLPPPSSPSSEVSRRLMMNGTIQPSSFR